MPRSRSSMTSSSSDAMPAGVRMVLFVLATFAAQMVAAELVGALFSPPGAEPADVLDRRMLLESTLTSLLAGAVVTALFVIWWDRRPAVSIGIALGGTAVRDTARGALLGLVGAGVAVGALVVLGGARMSVSLSSNATEFLGSSLALWYGGALALELLNRGYALQMAVRQFGPVPAVLGLAAFHALLDPAAREHPVVFMNLVLNGTVLGIAYVRSGSLLLPAAWHCTWNMVLGPILGFRISGYAIAGALGAPVMVGSANPLLTGGVYGIEGGLATTYAMALSAVVFLLPIRWSAPRLAASWSRWITGPPWSLVRSGRLRPESFEVSPMSKPLVRWNLPGETSDGRTPGDVDEHSDEHSDEGMDEHTGGQTGGLIDVVSADTAEMSPSGEDSPPGSAPGDARPDDEQDPSPFAPRSEDTAEGPPDTGNSNDRDDRC